MDRNIPYDIAIIGGGISSCVFASSHISNGFTGKIAIIEAGRQLGGRASTRNSLINKGWQLNHGSPNLNICNRKNNQLLKKFILELLKADIIISDKSDFIELSENPISDSKIKNQFLEGYNFAPKSSMANLSKDIISLNNLNDQIDFYFGTLINNLVFKNNYWLLTGKNGDTYKSKFLVCSSNLLLHKRSIDIFKTNQIPLRKAITTNLDRKIDSIISELKKQDYIQRLTFLIYTNSNYTFKDKYDEKCRYFFLNKSLQDKYKFERIIFQKQNNNRIGIVIHTKNIDLISEYNINKNENEFKENCILKFNTIFDRNSCINKLIDIKHFSIMKWRASQPNGKCISEDLQVCEKFNIGFCGDWIESEGFGRIEGAILSALKLSKKINLLN